MFLIGIDGLRPEAGAAVAALEKSLRNLQKHYRLVLVDRLAPPAAGGPVENQLMRYYNDRRWWARRKVFSQDRRPPKRVHAPPSLAFHAADAADAAPEAVAALRAMDVAVDAVIPVAAPADPETWRREEHPRLKVGHDYFVPAALLDACLSRVIAEGRLDLGGLFDASLAPSLDASPAPSLDASLAPSLDDVSLTSSLAPSFAPSLDPLIDGSIDPLINGPMDGSEGLASDLRRALAAPIWLSESIRRIKRYGGA